MSKSEVAIVTGAAGGIGQAIVAALAAQGVAVVGTGRDESRLRALGDGLSPEAAFSHVVADITAADAPRRIVEHALERFGRISYLVNNAGAGVWAPVHETSDAMLDEVIGISLRAPFRLSREVIPHMGKGCAIVTIGSTFGIMGGLDGGIYCAVKAALTGLTQTMAAQYGEQGIRANVVAPTVVRTPMTEAAWDYPAFQRINQGLTPFYRDCLPDDVANAVAFLCSAKGEFINGQVLPIDGGWSTTRMINPRFAA
ncbi:SDR family NAD(P)-dependent oxidoreductase [Sphingomonas tabacisoli]|uniref:SDR family NAD(P)-dependent oxidoreductase n=1 Tax=Sphingomonas tabacisoli TaxID=2249466 RepID=A0ABW4I314_9SPHN